ncbi:MAG: glutaredoxin family protein [Porticoccus sp.]|jgi:hypothetical protein|tara:strand:+ start:8034 stop:8285 length:252 start_codon:yes stop_codon:yes gene_type:complete
MNKIFTLYVGFHCHLCEQAKSLIADSLSDTGWVFHEINITDNELLYEKYRLRIPVIVSPQGEEKEWPFTAGQIKYLMASQDHL